MNLVASAGIAPALTSFEGWRLICSTTTPIARACPELHRGHVVRNHVAYLLAYKPFNGIGAI